MIYTIRGGRIGAGGVERVDGGERMRIACSRVFDPYSGASASNFCGALVRGDVDLFLLCGDGVSMVCV